MTPEEIGSRLLYRDGLMLIINKPAGMAVHKGPKGSRQRPEPGGLVRRAALRPAADAGAARRLDGPARGQIQGFFDIPFDNLFASPVILALHRKEMLRSEKAQGLVLVSPDAGGVERARAYAKRLDASVAMIDKRRTGPNVAKAMNIIGDVEGKTAIILDDMIDTAGTLTEAAGAVLDHGAKKVYAAATHGVLSRPRHRAHPASQARAGHRDRHDPALARGRSTARRSCSSRSPISWPKRSTASTTTTA